MIQIIAITSFILFSAPWGSDATCHTSSDDCKVEYGPWSECDPCTNLKSRHLQIISPAQFEGLPCPTDDVEHEACVPSTQCPTKPICPGKFNCGILGRCVDDNLVCNGEDDCGNNADEKNCSINTFSRSIEKCLNRPAVPYLDQIGSGFHVPTGHLGGRAVDNQRYQGYCRNAFDGDQQQVYRMPYNVNNFHFRVSASDQLDASSYSSLYDYTSEKDSENSLKWNAGANIKGSGFVESGKISGALGGSFGYSHTDTFKSIYKSMKDTQSTMFKVGSTITVAEFLMRSDAFLLDGFLEERIHKLPTHFNAKSYFDLFDEFGAFYLHSGVLGGKYEHFYTFSNSDLKKSSQTTTTMKKCMQFAMSLSLGFEGGFSVSGGANGGFTKCQDANGNTQSSSDVAETATHKIVNILGGTTKAAGALSRAAMVGNATFQDSKYELWVDSVKQNPALLQKTFRPICDLIQSTKTNDQSTKISICYNATLAYLEKYAVSKCQACKNGQVINIQGQCHCACKPNYMGQNCNTYVRDGVTPAPHSELGKFIKRSEVPVEESSDNQADIKFVTVDGVATNPPYMQWKDVGQYDTVLKMMENRLFLLNSTEGAYIWQNGKATGKYWITEYDEFLNFIRSTEIDFTTMEDCQIIPKQTGMCIIRDFDVDSHDNIVLSVKVSGGQQSAVYKVDMYGKAFMKIDRPCAMDDSSDFKTVYVSTTCTDSIVVSCPSLSPATVKVFTAHGEPEDMTQFAGFSDKITGIQHFDGNVWIHTADNRVAAYDLASWQEVFSYSGINDPSKVGSPIDYSQLSVDFLGNLVLAQTHNEQTGKTNYKLTIIEGTSKEVLANVKLDQWNYCTDIATYRGKMYTLCTGKGVLNMNQHSILVFDYLK